MKFFNAMNREFIHVDTNIKEFNYNINALDYEEMELPKRFEGAKAHVFSSIENLESYDKVLINIHLSESEECILSDDEISDIFSNYLMAYGMLFQENDKRVLLPKESLMQKFTCSPSVLSMITVRFIVKNPIQIIINRNYTNENGEILGEERVMLS